MPEKSQKNFWSPGGPGEQAKWGSWGAIFLKNSILCIFGDITSNLSKDRCQKLPQKIFDPQGDRGASKCGHLGASFLKIWILGIFLWYFYMNWLGQFERNFGQNSQCARITSKPNLFINWNLKFPSEFPSGRNSIAICSSGLSQALTLAKEVAKLACCQKV